MLDKERVACTRAAGVMLIVCGVPTLAVGFVLLFILKNSGPTYIIGVVMLIVAGLLILSGVVCSIVACLLRLNKKVGDTGRHPSSHYKMRRGSQTTCYTTATMDTVATRLTVAQPSSYYNVHEDESRPPAYINTVQEWDGSPDHHPPSQNISVPIDEHGQQYGMQRF